MFDPATITQPKGATFTMNILVSGVQNVLSVPLQMSYDPAKLELVNVSNGGFLSQDGQAVALVHRGDETTGSVQITATRPPGAGGVSGQGAVVTLTFLAKSSGQSPVTIIRGGARDPYAGDPGEWGAGSGYGSVSQARRFRSRWEWCAKQEIGCGGRAALL
jgi:general secretion pathway protein D